MRETRLDREVEIYTTKNPDDGQSPKTQYLCGHLRCQSFLCNMYPPHTRCKMAKACNCRKHASANV
jgi:hypothetical protein